MKIEGWAVVAEDKSVEFHQRLPEHITSALPIHVYRAVLTYKTKATPKKGKVQK